MNLIKTLSIILITTLSLTGIKSTSLFKKEEIGTVTYKIGKESKTISLRSQSISYGVQKVGPKDDLKSHAAIGFSVNDLENGVVFKFSVKDDKVLTVLDGQYPLRYPGGFNEGEPIRSTSLMIIDTKNGSYTLQSKKGGICEIFQKGTSLKVTIKNALVLNGDVEIPFEFTLSANNVKVKIKTD